MRSPLQRLSKDLALYSVGSIGLKLVNFLTVPLLTRLFSPADFGVMETIGAFLGVGLFVVTMGLDSATQRLYFDCAPDDQIARRVVVSTAFWVLLGGSLLLTAAVLLACIFSNLRWLGLADYTYLLPVALMTLPFTVLGSFGLETLRLQQRPLVYSLASFSMAVINIGAILFFVEYWHGGLLGNYFGLLIGGFFAALVNIFMARRLLSFQFDIQRFKALLAYGLPLVPTSASIWVLQLADRFFLLHYVSTTEIGLYSVGVRLSNVMVLVVSAFGTAWAPFILDLANRDRFNEPTVRSKVMLYYAAVLGFGVVGITAFARDFFLVVTDPKFEAAYQVVGLLAGSVAIIGLNTVIITGISLARQTRFFAIYTFIAAIINIVLNFLLIPTWGMIGAAGATLLSYIVLLILYWNKAQQLSPAPFDASRLILVFIFTSLFAILGTLTRLPMGWDIGFRIGLVLVFPVLLGIFNILPRSSLQYILEWMRLQWLAR